MPTVADIAAAQSTRIQDAARPQTSQASQKALGSSLDTFLQLLIGQIQNQSPLDPMSTKDFTDQLTQFGSIEQQIYTNELTEKLLTQLSGNATGAVVSYLGQNVTTKGSSLELTGDGAQWTYSMPTGANEAVMSVKDEFGGVIFQETRSLDKGTHTYDWNGKGSAGNPAPEGRYSLSIEARDSFGKTIPVDIYTSGMVDSIDMSGSEPTLTVNGNQILMSDIKSVSRMV
jgi:flagellar basal-body rod modification protein FlgD